MLIPVAPSLAGIAPSVVAVLQPGEQIAVLVLALATLVLGLVLGLILPRLFSRERRARALGLRAPDAYSAAPQEELWDQLLETCYTDYRIQAIAAFDRDFFDTLHEPVYVSPDIVRSDSPLLPGELCVYEFNNIKGFRELWSGRHERLREAIEYLAVEEHKLYLRLFEDLLQELEKLPDIASVQWLSVRTPDHHHIVLFTDDLRRVIGIVPGLLSLHEPAQSDTP